MVCVRATRENNHSLSTTGQLRNYEKGLHYDILKKEKVAKCTLLGMSGKEKMSDEIFEFLKSPDSISYNFSTIFAHFHTKRDFY